MRTWGKHGWGKYHPANLLPTFTLTWSTEQVKLLATRESTSQGHPQIPPLSLMHLPSNEHCMLLQVNFLAHVQNTQICLMNKINYSWYLDLHIRWFTMCEQTILTVPKVAWVNLLPLTSVNASWPHFHYLAFWYFVLLPGATFSFVTHFYLLASAFAGPLITQTNACSGGTCSLLQRKTNQRRTAELVTCFPGRSKTFIFAKAAVARSLALGLGRSTGATKASWGSNLQKSLGGVLHVSTCHSFKVCFIITACIEGYLFHSGLNSLLKTSGEIPII